MSLVTSKYYSLQISKTFKKEEVEANFFKT